MAGEWSAFLAMAVPTVTHNDLIPFRRKGKRTDTDQAAEPERELTPEELLKELGL